MIPHRFGKDCWRRRSVPTSTWMLCNEKGELDGVGILIFLSLKNITTITIPSMLTIIDTLDHPKCHSSWSGFMKIFWIIQSFQAHGRWETLQDIYCVYCGYIGTFLFFFL